MYINILVVKWFTARQNINEFELSNVSLKLD